MDRIRESFRIVDLWREGQSCRQNRFGSLGIFFLNSEQQTVLSVFRSASKLPLL